MRPLTILLDCDDTISIFMETCIMKYNEIYGTNHTIDEITDWNIDGIFEHTLWSIFDKTDVLQHMPLKEGAFETIKKWYDKGHTIVIVTGVHTVNSYADKLRWLDLIGLRPYIYEVIPTRHKELVCGDVFVDDKPEYLFEWMQTNPDGVPLLMTAQHNKNKRIHNLLRVDTWQEIEQYVTLLEHIKK